MLGLIAGAISNVLSTILGLVLLLPSIAVGIRRMHDTNHCGWWIICPIVNLIFCLFPSDPQPNRYGEPVA